MRRVEQLVSHLSANATLAETPDLQDERVPTSNYASRQQPLFNNSKLPPAIETNLAINNIGVFQVSNISSTISDLKTYPNYLCRTRLGPRMLSGKQQSYTEYVTNDTVAIMDMMRQGANSSAKGFMRAGPRQRIVWAPGEVRAAMCTAGGLCPGLNNVVAELFETLYYNYGVDTIYGIQYGFRGFCNPKYKPWKLMTPESVRGIHNLGGSVLGSARGGFDKEKIIDACIQHAVNQIYIVGGDGTHYAANLLAGEAASRGVKMCVVGVPKTIDNDIGLIDRSFGFNTAVSEARKAIASAFVEAKSEVNGIGIVRLMGRHAGYIAATATLAAKHVDLCLIPEVKFPLNGVLEYTQQVLRRQGYVVLVVAEGAGSHLVEGSGVVDAGGHKQLAEIGQFLMHHFSKHFEEAGVKVNLKYHDPSYMIRSCPANATDSVYCAALAQNAVHGAMSGFTAFTSGLINNRSVMIPMPLITATSPSYLNKNGRTWERVSSVTHQPNWNSCV